MTDIEKQAEAGSADAQFAMGETCQYGNAAGGIPKDLAKAAFWYQKAAAQGSVRAMNALGDLYYAGSSGPSPQGTPSQGILSQDYGKALFWYRKAADLGDASAQYILGVMRENGEGAPKDPEAARLWYQKAAAQGHEGARLHLQKQYGMPAGEGMRTAAQPSLSGNAHAGDGSSRISLDKKRPAAKNASPGISLEKAGAISRGNAAGQRDTLPNPAPGPAQRPATAPVSAQKPQSKGAGKRLALAAAGILALVLFANMADKPSERSAYRSSSGGTYAPSSEPSDTPGSYGADTGRGYGSAQDAAPKALSKIRKPSIKGTAAAGRPSCAPQNTGRRIPRGR